MKNQKNLPFFLSFMFVVSLFLTPSIAHAQKQMRKLPASGIAKVTDGNTFWRRYTLDRVHFKHDKTFIQQINDGWKNLPAGTTFTGTWKISDDSLCWKYDTKTAQQNTLPSAAICFDVYTTNPKKGFMTSHEDKLFFKPSGSGESGPNIFTFDQWHFDNYIFDAEYVEPLKAGLQQSKIYRKEHRGDIPDGTIKREEMLPYMQEYYDEMINRIFFIVGDYMFFDDKGNYYWIWSKDIIEADGNISKMVAKVRRGTWKIKDNIHCWRHNSGSSCEYVFPKGKGLMRDYDGIFGVHHSYFTRVHGEGAVGHMDTEDSESPELYELLKKMSK